MNRTPYELRIANLELERTSWRTTWIDIRDYICQTRGYFDDQPNSGTKLDHKKVLDGHATLSLRIMAAGLMSGLTSPARPWFKLGIADHDLMKFKPVKDYLFQCEQILTTVFARSNIYSMFYSHYEELGSFGTSAAIILPDYKTVLRSRSFTCGEYFLGVSEDGRVDSFARVYWFTANQLVKEFGEENVTASTLQMYKEDNGDKWVKCFYLIEPNDNRIRERSDFKNMPFRSVYWEQGAPADKTLRKGGYKTFPVVAPRWDVVKTSESYGKGPGWLALGDTRMLQKLQTKKLEALDKMIDPPMMADAQVHGEINTLPGGITRTGSTLPNAGLRPAYQIQPDFKAILETIQETKGSISKAFYSDLFLMLANSTNGQMTAREISARYEEKLLQLGPVLDRLDQECLTPTVERGFHMSEEAGILPPVPQALQGHAIDVTYISLLAQAQKMTGLSSIGQTFQLVNEIREAYPDVVDVIDADEAIANYAEIQGVPPSMIRDPNEKAAIRKARAEQMQKAQEQEQMMNAADTAQKLGNTPLGDGSALDGLMKGLKGRSAQNAAVPN